jgi:hypothetical protein
LLVVDFVGLWPPGLWELCEKPAGFSKPLWARLEGR